MKYIDGRRLYRGFLAGCQTVLARRDYLNKINVFPVPDGDTGANLAATLQNILSASKYTSSLKATATEMANNALIMARGNSGIIFSQFLYGLSEELENERRLTIAKFSEAVNRAVDYMYNALLNPVEGTMITVIKDWAESMLRFSQLSSDLHQVFENSLYKAHESLAATRYKLEVLKKAGVVDAGGMGFVLFLEGIISYVKSGSLDKLVETAESFDLKEIHDETLGKYRYCCESLLTDLTLSPRELVKSLEDYGDSIAIAGGKKRLHLHIHCNDPTRVYHHLSKIANIGNVKVDDMKWQHDIQEDQRYPIGIITDSAADFPPEYKEKYQINTIPIKLIFGNDIYLDKVSIDSKSFFRKIESGSEFPHSSQPDPVQVGSTVDFVNSHYDQVLSISVSSKLSGVYNLLQQADHSDKQNYIFDSRHLSVSQGLLVLRAAEAISQGMNFKELEHKLPVWREGTWIFTDIHSLNYLVRGGRISPLKGKIAKFLNLKPIVTVDDQGNGLANGKSFSRKANMKKIIKLCRDKVAEGKLWNYAIVHAECPQRAKIYAGELTQILGKAPLYIMEIGPVVGVHNGPGACAVGLLVEKE